MVVLDNGFLGMVRQWQELFFEGRYAHTEMQNPRFVELANAFGVPALVVTTREELPGAIDAMLAHPGAFLLQVCVAREENVFPMVPPGASVAEVRLER